MGATYRSAYGVGLVVLIAGTMLAPLAVSEDLPGGVQDAAREAQRAAKEAEDAARRDAQQKQREAERAAATVEEKGAAQAQQTQTFAIGVAAIALAAAEEGLRLAQEFIIGASLALENLARPAPPPQDEAGFRSQSTDYALVRPSITAPLVWVTASVSGLVVLLLAARKLLGLGALPLLSRIAHSDIYNNDARRTIHELVTGEPGQCLNDLVAHTGYSRNAVSYHLFVLEKEEEVVSVKDGKYRRYFARNGKYVNGAKNVVAALRNETTLKLAQVVLERPGAIQRDLCVELGATPSATCWHAKRLLDLGVIRKERVANTVKYYPGDALSRYDLSDMGLRRLEPAGNNATPS
jgi:predicted transcriptional regulator